MRQNIEFELIGHDSPTGKYPSPVVPIGRVLDTGELVAVYIDSIKFEPVLEPVAKNATFVHHDATLKELLKNFDYRKDSLFALTPEDVKFYAVQDEEKFFKGLLADEDFASTNPFLRLSLAEATKDFLLIRRELEPCENFLQENSPDLAPVWKLEKKIALLGLLTFKQADEENFLIERKQLQVLHQIVTRELLSSVRELEAQQIKPIVEQSKLSQREQEIDDLEKKLDAIQKEALFNKAVTKDLGTYLYRLLAIDLSEATTPLKELLMLVTDKMQSLSPPNNLIFLSQTDPIEYKRLRLDLSELFDQKRLVAGWLQITQEILDLTSANQWMVSTQALQAVKCLQNEMQQIKEQIQLLESRIKDLDLLLYLSPKKSQRTSSLQKSQASSEPISTPLSDEQAMKESRSLEQKVSKVPKRTEVPQEGLRCLPSSQWAKIPTMAESQTSDVWIDTPLSDERSGFDEPLRIPLQDLETSGRERIQVSR